MYFVKYGDRYLHDPRIDDCLLLDLSFDAEENSCGFCDFTIYPNHPLYNDIRERDASNPVTVYDDGVLLFSGFIYELGKEFYLDGHVKCKGDLDYLSESIVRPYSTHARGYGTQAPSRPSEYFEWLITQHNNQVDPNKKFVVGINEANSLDPNTYIFRESNEYPTTIDEISEKLLKILGGYIRVRIENGIRYIDYISEWTSSNKQLLDFGVNLTDYTQTDDSLEVSTFVVPLGAKLKETDYEYNDGYFRTLDPSLDRTKEYYTKSEDSYSKVSDDLTQFEVGVSYYEYNPDNDESDTALTIDGLTEGLPSGDYFKRGDMIYCDSAVKKYGWIGCVYENQDLTEKSNLLTKGLNHLKERVSPKRTIEIKAVDMHLVNPELSPIRIGEHVRVRSRPHNLDSYFLCSNISLDLNDPGNSLYTLGTTFDTLTGQQNKIINELNASINKQFETSVRLSDRTDKAANNSAHAQAQASAAYEAAQQAASNVTLVQSQLTAVQGDTATALANASSAEAAANQASATAAQVSTDISEVKGDATSLRDAIDGQIETKITTMTADYVSETDLSTTETTLRSEISTSASTIETTVDQTYAKKTELESAKTDLQTSLRQNSDSITAVASEVSTVSANVETLEESVNTQFSSVNLTASGITARVGTLEHDFDASTSGSRNVLSGTGATRVHTGTGVANETLPLYSFTNWYFAQRSFAGKHIAISFDWSTTATSGTFLIQMNGSPWYWLCDSVTISADNTSGTVTYITDGSVGFDSGTYTGLSLRTDNVDGSFTINNFMCTVSENITEWQPAPEDILSGIEDASKSATDYLNFSANGLTVGDMTAGTLGGNVNLSSTGVKLRNGETVLAEFTEYGIDYDKPVTFKADGVFVDNGDAHTYLGRNTVLWTAPDGYYMNGSQSITLSENITRQMSGAIFGWALYQNGVSQSTKWKYFFVPKWHVITNPGAGVTMSDPYSGFMKYIYISNGNCSGCDENMQSGTVNGIAYNNANYTLRCVIGV